MVLFFSITLYSIGYVRSWHHFLFLDNIGKKFKENLKKVLNTFENIMENGAFAPEEQFLRFPLYFQIHDTSRASNGIIMACGLTQKIVFFLNS